MSSRVRGSIVPSVLAASLSTTVGGAFVETVGADRVAAADVKITFVSGPRPLAHIPPDARDAGTDPDPDGGKRGTSNIRFRIVRDPSDHGPLPKLIDGRIAALTVTWSDSAVFKGPSDVERFLRQLMTIATGSIYTHAPWAQRQGVPSVVAVVHEIDGTAGSWHVWYGWPSIYCVYRDGRGTWWFGHWMNVDALRLPGG